MGQGTVRAGIGTTGSIACPSVVRGGGILHTSCSYPFQLENSQLGVGDFSVSSLLLVVLLMAGKADDILARLAVLQPTTTRVT